MSRPEVSPPEGTDFILVGIVRRAHGIRGEVYVEPVSDVVERFSSLGRVLVRHEGRTGERVVDKVRLSGKLVAIKFCGVDDRTAAERLAGAELGVRRDEVYPLPDDTYYVFEIVGSRVVDGSRREVGIVEDVLKLPANDVFVVSGPRGEVLVPVVRDVVKKIDREAKTITIEAIDGLLD